MKKILIIAYLFPPTSAIDAAIRTLKFVKYLPHFSYKPYVISVKDAFLSKDETLLDEIPKDTSVLRIYQFDPRYIFKLFKGRGNRKKIRTYSRRINLFRNFINRLIFPDSAVGWILPAVLFAYRRIQKEKIDIIFATAPPFSAFIIGYLFKRLTAKPLIIDYRDLLISGKKITNNIDIFSKLKTILERKIIRYSDAVITTSAEFKQTLTNAIGLPPDKFYVITNGFDREDFKLPEIEENSDTFKIYYAGYLYKKRTPFLFFDAMKDLISQKSFSHNVQVKIIGMVENDILNCSSLCFLLKKKYLSIESMLPYKDSIKTLNYADIFLLTADIDILGMLPAKLFEYMAFNKPILAIAPRNSSTVNFINKFNLGIGVDFFNKAAIEEAILKLYRYTKIDRIKMNRDRDFIDKFERKNLTKKLVEIIEKLRYT